MFLNDTLTAPEFYSASLEVMGSKTQAVRVKFKIYIDGKALTAAVLVMNWVSLQLKD